MSKIRVLFADDNKEFCDVVGNYLNKQKDIEIVSLAYDGMTAYNQICNLKPDVVVLDGIMPKFDGLEVLEKLNIKKNPENSPMRAVFLCRFTYIDNILSVNQFALLYNLLRKTAQIVL